MQDPRMPLLEEFPNPMMPQEKKKKKKKGSAQKGSSSKLRKTDVQDKPVPKASNRNEASPFGQHPERSTSDSLPDSSVSSNEYRTLRRKYLLMEEESFALGSSLKGLENDVKILEDQKLALLDELVVLEGLIEPSEFQSLSQGKL